MTDAASTLVLKKVLIVDDDPTVRRVLGHKFASSGFLVEEGANGEEGLRAMQKQRFNCIILDMKMPEKNGLVVLRERMHTQNADTPIFVLTSLPNDIVNDSLHNLGVEKVLNKSAQSPGEVVQLVKSEIFEV